MVASLDFAVVVVAVLIAVFIADVVVVVGAVNLVLAF